MLPTLLKLDGVDLPRSQLNQSMRSALDASKLNVSTAAKSPGKHNTTRSTTGQSPKFRLVPKCAMVEKKVLLRPSALAMHLPASSLLLPTD